MNFLSYISNSLSNKLKEYSKTVDLSKTNHLQYYTNLIKKDENINKLYKKEVGIIGSFVLESGLVSDQCKIDMLSITDKKDAEKLRNICLVMHNYEKYEQFKQTYFNESPSAKIRYNNSYSVPLGGTRKKRNPKKKHRRSRCVLKS